MFNMKYTVPIASTMLGATALILAAVLRFSPSSTETQDKQKRIEIAMYVTLSLAVAGFLFKFIQNRRIMYRQRVNLIPYVSNATLHREPPPTPPPELLQRRDSNLSATIPYWSSSQPTIYRSGGEEEGYFNDV